MGSVTVSVRQEIQDQLNAIKQHIPELKEYEGDLLAKEFFYFSVREAAALFAVKKE
jgi:hypothetical protein